MGEKPTEDPSDAVNLNSSKSNRVMEPGTETGGDGEPDALRGKPSKEQLADQGEERRATEAGGRRCDDSKGCLSVAIPQATRLASSTQRNH